VPKTYREAAVGVIAATAEVVAWPIPGEDIIVGNPDAQGTIFSRSDDSCLARGVWRCTPGKFIWHFTWDETLSVFEGRATLELDDGGIIELEPGVVAFIGRGQDVTWTVHETIVKSFHIDSPDPLGF